MSKWNVFGDLPYKVFLNSVKGFKPYDLATMSLAPKKLAPDAFDHLGAAYLKFFILV